MTPSPDCLALIKRFEGCARKLADGRVSAYPDPASGGAPWTIGWGTTGRDVRRGTIWTQARCDARLASDAAAFAERIDAALGGAATSQRQFDALLSFAYNVGIGAVARSSLLRLHKSGAFDAAAAQFARWNKAGGKVLPGLTRRRAQEAALYRG